MKRPIKERLNIPLSIDKEDSKGKAYEMLEENSSESEDDFEIMCNIVLVLLVEYDMVIEVIDVEEEYSAKTLFEHKPVCYYVMNNGCVEEQNSVLENTYMGMKSHLKPLFIKAKVDNFCVNKVQVDSGTTVNLMPQSMLIRIGKFDKNLWPHNMVLSNYEGMIGHSLGEIQVDLAVGTTI